MLERARTLEEEGLLGAAEECYRKAAAESTSGCYAFVSFLERLGRVDEAIEQYRRLLERQEAARDIERVSTCEMLADLLSESGRLTEAVALYQRSIAIQTEQVGPEHPEIANSYRDLARRYTRHGLIKEAEAAYQHMVRIRLRCQGPNHPGLIPGLVELADFLARQGMPREQVVARARVLIEEFDTGNGLLRQLEEMLPE